VYATCSLLAAEGEEVASAFSLAHRGAFESIDARGALAAAGVAQPEGLVQDMQLRVWPHRQQTDGFFAAVWQRL
jgi:16S rRNA (cytosine967-C5)-methyltransferase